MSNPSQPPQRIAPLAPADFSDEARELLSMPLKGFESAETPHFLATLVRHPGLYRRYAPFAGKLLVNGKLPPRDREYVILRVSWLCQADLEWGTHVALAKENVGLSSTEIARIMAGPADPGHSEHERTLLQAVDEWQATAMISDATWAGLAKTYNDMQLLELPMLIGAYRMIVSWQNVLRIQRQGNNQGLAAR